jgi:phosphoribosylaminoimidazolecarboxamide formyltransferase/IMP cyclohydrolase
MQLGDVGFSLPQVVVDPTDYSMLLDALNSGKNDQDFRKRLAWKAYQHTATYDSTVAEWMWSQIGMLLT